MTILVPSCSELHARIAIELEWGEMVDAMLEESEGRILAAGDAASFAINHNATVSFVAFGSEKPPGTLPKYGHMPGQVWCTTDLLVDLQSGLDFSAPI